MITIVVKKKTKGSFYIAQYPVRWTAQSASHFLPSLTDLFIPTPFLASPGSILARQQLRAKTKSLTFPPLSIARYSFIQRSRLRRLRSERKMPNLRNGSKGGFEPGLSRLRVRHSTTELLRSTAVRKCSHGKVVLNAYLQCCGVPDKRICKLMFGLLARHLCTRRRLVTSWLASCVKFELYLR